MSDNIKITLQNALSIVGLIVAAALSYSAIMSKVDHNKEANSRQDVLISKNTSDIANVNVGMARQETRDIEMFRRLDKIQSDIDKWEPAPKRGGE